MRKFAEPKALEEGLECIERSAFFGCIVLKKELIEIPTTEFALNYSGFAVVESERGRTARRLEANFRRIGVD